MNEILAPAPKNQIRLLKTFPDRSLHVCLVLIGQLDHKFKYNFTSVKRILYYYDVN